MKNLSAGAAPGWMTVRVAGVEFAFAIEAVGEVLPTPPVSPVPLVPAWVAGIVSVRGDVIPVVDAGIRLFGAAASRDGRLVLCAPDAAGERTGVLVDTVTGLIDRSDGELDASARAGAASRGFPARFASGIVTHGESGRIPLLDLGALLDSGIEDGAATAREI